jgi:hypothetical protein
MALAAGRQSGGLCPPAAPHSSCPLGGRCWQQRRHGRRQSHSLGRRIAGFYGRWRRRGSSQDFVRLLLLVFLLLLLVLILLVRRSHLGGARCILQRHGRRQRGIKVDRCFSCFLVECHRSQFVRTCIVKSDVCRLEDPAGGFRFIPTTSPIVLTQDRRTLTSIYILFAHTFQPVLW